MSARAITVTLAGQTYEVRRLPALRAVAWRKEAEALLARFPKMIDLYNEETDNVVRASLDVLNASHGVIEALVDIVIKCSPAIEEDKERILDEAYEEEYMAVFQDVMVLNAPLAELAHSVATEQPATNGEVTPTTSTKSPLPNGG